MSPAFIIGLAGRAGVGKDYTCQRLIERFPFFTRFALADYAKDILCDTIKISRQDLEAPEVNPDARAGILEHHTDLGLEPCRVFNNKEHHRHALIGITGFIKAIVPDFFMQVLVQHITKTGQQFVILTDIRFPFEFYWVHNADAILGSHTVGLNVCISRKDFSPRPDCGYCLTPNDEGQADLRFVNSDDQTTFPQLFSWVDKRLAEFGRKSGAKVPRKRGSF